MAGFSFFVLSVLIQSYVAQCISYSVNRDLRWESTPLKTVTYPQSYVCLERCLKTCRMSSQCRRVNAYWDAVRSVLKCELLPTPVRQELNLTSAPGWIFMQKEWILAFRISSRVGQSALDAWYEDGRHDDVTVLQSCVDPTSSEPCTSHFRSQILDRWNNIDQVRMSVYKDGVVVAEVTLDGRDSTRTSWLDKSRLMSSTWTDMDRNAQSNIFSVEGHDPSKRRFFLNSHFGGCLYDLGWLFVADHHPNAGTKILDQCQYDVHNSLPVILYSPSSTAGLLNNSTVEADFILIHVTFLE